LPATAGSGAGSEAVVATVLVVPLSCTTPRLSAVSLALMLALTESSSPRSAFCPDSSVLFRLTAGI
jgi:hypothetical protein